jgi:hypothetical protein
MKTLMMVFRASMISEMEQLLQQNGITAYTLFNNVEGKGETGSVVGSFFYPGVNSIVLAVLPSDRAERVVSALKAFHEARVKAAKGQAIPFKLFAFPCEELI